MELLKRFESLTRDSQYRVIKCLCNIAKETNDSDLPYYKTMLNYY